MKTPKRLQPLLDDGLIDEVLTQLMSGKEAQVYVVRCGEEVRCAKVFKEAKQRSFKQAVQYQEGRKERNSRRARAMAKKTRYGQKALAYHAKVIEDVVKMLCAGLIHGDLSEFNVLVDADGPVIIDLPQAVDAAGNNSAEAMLERDVNNMRAYFGRFAPELLDTHYAKEMWALYEAGELHPESKLSGYFEHDSHIADVDELMEVIDDAKEEEAERQARIRGDDDDPDAPSY